MNIPGYTHLITALREEIVREDDSPALIGREVLHYGRYPKEDEDLVIKDQGTIHHIHCEKDVRDESNFGYFQTTLVDVQTDEGVKKYPASMLFIKDL